MAFIFNSFQSTSSVLLPLSTSSSLLRALPLALWKIARAEIKGRDSIKKKRRERIYVYKKRSSLFIRAAVSFVCSLSFSLSLAFLCQLYFLYHLLDFSLVYRVASAPQAIHWSAFYINSSGAMLFLLTSPAV
jgi:hypothetical protein